MRLRLERGSHLPLVTQLARAITAEVRAGRAAPGERLPGSRALAGDLGVHRNTVVAAFEELAAEGWVETRAGAGTFVSRALPTDAAGHAGPRGRGRGPRLPRPGPSLAPTQAPRGQLRLDLALPDPRLFDLALWARAYRRAARRGREAIHTYGDGRGHPRLRAALAEHLRRRRGLVVGDDELLITRGSQMALYLAGAALLRPGDRVAVEALGYAPAWRAFEAAGARLEPIPLDRDGAVIAGLARRPPRALYLTPHHQYPTTVTLSAARRLELRGLAAASGIAIVEDDYDGDHHYDAMPVPPLAADDPSGAVIHIGTLSKLLAPGLRLGYAVAAPAVIARMVGLRRLVDRDGDVLGELACAELLEDGELERHARRSRRVYRSRRDGFGDALRVALDGAAGFDLPAGGLALWLRLPRGVSAAGLAAACAARGLAIGAEGYALRGRAPAPAGVRLGWAAHDEATLRGAARTLGAALRAARRR